jgi:hypothetical protein
MATSSKNLSIGGPFGLFSTGTNFVCALFEKNGLDKEVGGCNFYRQKHKPPAVVHDFLFNRASVKYYRIWFHSLIEYLLRQNATTGLDMSVDGGFLKLMDIVNNDTCFGSEPSRDPSLPYESGGCCCSTLDGPRQILALYNRTLRSSSFGGVFETEVLTAFTFSVPSHLVTDPVNVSSISTPLRRAK